MIKDIQSFREQMDAYLKKDSSRWQYGNEILYRMCREDPKHDDPDVIVAKIWLIGRTYAAAIERRKNAEGFAGDFYYDVVAPAIRTISGDLDSRLAAINDIEIPDENATDLVIETHHLLMKAFYEITGLEKRSLAAKYLHFHAPAAFYIYDSIANRRSRMLVALDNAKAAEHYFKDVDREYCDFYLRCLEIKAKTKTLFGKDLTPRETDGFLLGNT